MSNYTVKNLKDVEDVVGSQAPQVEGRFARPEGGDGEMIADWWTD